MDEAATILSAAKKVALAALDGEWVIHAGVKSVLIEQRMHDVGTLPGVVQLIPGARRITVTLEIEAEQ